jgi:hypothetical protein
MLWIEERCEWIGIVVEERSHHFEGENWGVEEDIYTAGPFQLDADHARLILSIYDDPEISIDQVLRKNPSELKAAAQKKAAAEEVVREEQREKARERNRAVLKEYSEARALRRQNTRLDAPSATAR